MSAGQSGFQRSLATTFERLERPSSVMTAVFIGAFLETTVLPIPFEVLLIPLMLRHRHHVWLIVLAALAGCMAGAFTGYLVGLFAYQSFGQALLEWLGAAEAMDSFTGRLDNNGFWAIFLVGFTPVPVQVATLGAGFTGFSLLVFTIAMVLSRGLRYGALGGLVHWFGADAQRLLRRHRKSALAIGLILLVVLVWLLFGGAAR